MAKVKGTSKAKLNAIRKIEERIEAKWMFEIEEDIRSELAIWIFDLLKEMQDHTEQELEKVISSDKDDRCENELFVERYYGLEPSITNEKTKVITDFGMLVNMLSMYQAKSKDNSIPDIRSLINNWFYLRNGERLNEETLNNILTNLKQSLQPKECTNRHTTALLNDGLCYGCKCLSDEK